MHGTDRGSAIQGQVTRNLCSLQKVLGQVEVAQGVGSEGGQRRTAELTGDESGQTPAQDVVEAHGAVIDVPGFSAAPVKVQRLQQRPAHGAQVQELQQDGHHRARQLRPRPSLPALGQPVRPQTHHPDLGELSALLSSPPPL